MRLSVFMATITLAIATTALAEDQKPATEGWYDACNAYPGGGKAPGTNCKILESASLSIIPSYKYHSPAPAEDRSPPSFPAPLGSTYIDVCADDFLDTMDISSCRARMVAQATPSRTITLYAATHDGPNKSATIDFGGDKVTYSGDLPVDDAAKVFFDAVLRQDRQHR